MKRLILSVLCLLAAGMLSFHAAAQVDTSHFRQLDIKLNEYFKSLEGESIPTKNAECDILIGTAKDSLLRQHIALKVYDHYLHSKLMGDEGVAVHTVDRWFTSGDVRLDSEIELMNAQIFADFNRQSLLGEKAPELDMVTSEGDSVHVGGPCRQYRLLLFYDTDCAKCRVETVMLKSLLNDKDYPILFYAIYTGDKADEWKEWQESRFTLKAQDTQVINLWDPEVKSDFQRKYGVLKTPRLFLLDRNGTIIGRGLDTDSLEQLMDAILEDENYQYGSDDSNILMDKLFISYGDSLRPENVLDIAALIKDRTIGGDGIAPHDYRDTVTYKHMEGDLLYYLSQRREEALKEGMLPFIKTYIQDCPDIWNTEDDSLRVLGLADLMADMISRTPVGSKLPSEPIKGWKKLCHKGGYVIFHTEGCPDCQKAIEYVTAQGYRWIDVNVDRIEETNDLLMQKLLDTFDLSSLPLVIEVAKGGTIRRRYVSLP